MKVHIDTSPISDPKHNVRGVGSYIKSLTKALENRSDVEIMSDGKKLKKGTVLHIPYFDPFQRTVMESGDGKLVITIHDLIPIRFPEHFPSGIKGRIIWEEQKRKLKNVDAIITDSQVSKADIIKYAKLPEENIHVVHLAADNMFVQKEIPNTKTQELTEKYKIPKNFVLYVGDVTWNKNLPSLIKACNKKNIPLVLVGKAIKNTEYDRGNVWNKDLVEVQGLIKNEKNVYSLGYVDEQELVALYNIATLFAFPSRYEGFGLPVLEAMKCGTPVVTTHRGSLHEVSEDAAYIVDPDKVDDIAEGIEKVYTDKRIRRDLSKKGQVQAKKFSWKKTADETIRVYEKVFGK